VILFDPATICIDGRDARAGGVCSGGDLDGRQTFRHRLAQRFEKITDDQRGWSWSTRPITQQAVAGLRQDLDRLWQAIESRDIYVLSDEVYEFISFSESH